MKIDYAVSDDDGAMTLDSVRTVVLKIYVNFPDFMPTPVYYVYTYLTLFSLSSSTVLFTTVIYQRLQRRVVKCGLAEMWEAD